MRAVNVFMTIGFVCLWSFGTSVSSALAADPPTAHAADDHHDHGDKAAGAKHDHGNHAAATPAAAGQAGGGQHAPGNAAHHEQDEGIPGLTPGRDLALWSLVTFLIVLGILRATAWKPLLDGLYQRETSIKQALADAEASQARSKALLAEHEAKIAKAHEEVREIIAEARRDAEHTKQEIVAAAQKEADDTKHRAIAEIERTRDQALAELFDFVTNNVVQATEKVVGRSLGAQDQERLVQQALAEMDLRRN